MAANFGWFAAIHRKLRVLLVDLDPQFNLSQYILGARGYEKLIEEDAPTIEAIFRGSKLPVRSGPLAPPIQEVVNWEDGSCLHLIPSSLELSRSMTHAVDRPHLMHDRLDGVRSRYDLIVIDCPPTESILWTAAYLATDFVFVPVKPDFASRIGLSSLVRSIEHFEKPSRSDLVPEIGGIIFNDTEETLEHGRARELIAGIAAQNGWRVFQNRVSHSHSYPAGARTGKPIFLTDNARSRKKDEFNLVAVECLAALFDRRTLDARRTPHPDATKRRNQAGRRRVPVGPDGWPILR